MINLGNIEISDLRLGASHVKAVYFGSEQVWGGKEPVPPTPTNDWLCFTATQANSTVKLNKNGSPGAISIETSTDGSTWSDYSWTDSTGDTLTLANVGDKIYLRAKTENQTIGSSNSNYYKFSMSGKIAASGNIQTLLNADGSRTDAPDYCYYSMFKGCTSLTTAPELPATELASNCYSYMFQGCSSLTTAPELPATTLALQCYFNMFDGCTSLTTAPELPATTLASFCYYYMFNHCTSLTTAPAILPATTLADYCYAGMFQGCTSLTQAPELPATTLASNCYQSMFNGCRKLSSIDVSFTAWYPTNATTDWLNNVAASGTFTCPTELPNTRGTSNIPEGWKRISDLLCFTAEKANSTLHLDKVGSPGAISIETSTDCKTWTDYSWTNSTGDTLTLANVGDKVYFIAKTENQTIGSSSSNYYKFVMTGQIAASGNIQTLLNADSSRTDAPAYCYYYMFYKCTSLTTAPKLHATTLANNCYFAMFNGCSSITSAPELPATTLASDCYRAMFQGCTSLTTAPELPAMTLVSGCYRNMFSSCTSLTSAPKLHATTLASSCYSYMFDKCRNLASIDVRFTSWDPTNATTNWLNNVAASGTFTCPAELPDTRGASNIPEGWTKADIKYPADSLKLHFDGIDNDGIGSHLSSTTDWVNIAPDTSADYKMVRKSGSWEDNSAVFTGLYNECFWLNTSAGQQVASLSTTGLLNDSWTYALAFYYDPSTLENYRGYIGRESHSFEKGGATHIMTFPSGVMMTIIGKDSSGVQTQWESNTNSNIKFSDYLNENNFNTIACSWDESTSTIRMYANGQKIGEIAQPNGILSNTVPNQPLTLGSGAQSSGSNRVCKGKIHDFLVYSRALTDAEISHVHYWQSTRFNA